MFHFLGSVLCWFSNYGKEVSKYCVCRPPEWEDDENEADEAYLEALIAGSDGDKDDVEEIRDHIAGSSRGKDGLTLDRICASCIMPPKGYFCSSMCKWCLIHKDFCKCRKERNADHLLGRLTEKQ